MKRIRKNITKVYVVTCEECDDMGNIFFNFKGVFLIEEDANRAKARLDFTTPDGELIEYAEISEYII